MSIVNTGYVRMPVDVPPVSRFASRAFDDPYASLQIYPPDRIPFPERLPPELHWVAGVSHAHGHPNIQPDTDPTADPDLDPFPNRPAHSHAAPASGARVDPQH